MVALMLFDMLYLGAWLADFIALLLVVLEVVRVKTGKVEGYDRKLMKWCIAVIAYCTVFAVCALLYTSVSILIALLLIDFLVIAIGVRFVKVGLRNIRKKRKYILLIIFGALLSTSEACMTVIHVVNGLSY